MPKRKRTEVFPSPSASEAPLSDKELKRRRRLITQWFPTAERSLHAALRLAAGFERQKYSRRKKSALANHDTKVISRIESEYAALKTMQLHQLAGQHIRKTIAKVKSLRECDAVPGAFKIAEGGEKSAAVLNVQARLFKAQNVRKVVDDLVAQLKGIAGVREKRRIDGMGEEDDTDGLKEQKKAKLEKYPEDEDNHNGSNDENGDEYPLHARVAAPSSVDEDSENPLSEGHRPLSVEYSDSNSDSERQADEDDESSRGGIKVAPPSGVEDELEEGSGSDSDGVSLPVPKPKSKRTAVEMDKVSTSTFLPSLSHAAYYSGSESEASDLDDLAPKKNRRGQRARQQIWEKKYGDKAKHLKKQERNKGWDPKRGAVGDEKKRRGKREDKSRAPRGRGPMQSGENAVPLGMRKSKRDDAGSLHPSWQAAKAAKERTVDIKPQGKKVVFD